MSDYISNRDPGDEQAERVVDHDRAREISEKWARFWNPESDPGTVGRAYLELRRWVRESHTSAGSCWYLDCPVCGDKEVSDE